MSITEKISCIRYEREFREKVFNFVSDNLPQNLKLAKCYHEFGEMSYEKKVIVKHYGVFKKFRELSAIPLLYISVHTTLGDEIRIFTKDHNLQLARNIAKKVKKQFKCGVSIIRE